MDPVPHKKIYGSGRYEAMLSQSRHSDEGFSLAVSPSFPGRKRDA
jgi:hypothetical protein